MKIGSIIKVLRDTKQMSKEIEINIHKSMEVINQRINFITKNLSYLTNASKLKPTGLNRNSDSLRDFLMLLTQIALMKNSSLPKASIWKCTRRDATNLRNHLNTASKYGGVCSSLLVNGLSFLKGITKVKEK